LEDTITEMQTNVVTALVFHFRNESPWM